MSRHIPQTFVQELLAQVNLVDLIERRISLKKAGSRFVAKCPFHQEKTASFSVDPQKQFYYCFGCHAHGNAISFIMAYDRVEFIDAIENLASSLGIPIPSEKTSPEILNLRKKQADLYSIMEKAAVFYQKFLFKSPEALEYLQKRGLSEKTIKTFGLGYAPNEWDAITKKTLEKQNLIAKLQEAGMICEKTGASKHYYDRFRNRIMFPIQNTQGQVIGFGARSIDEQQTPKYLNSPETPLFHKGNELYGLHLIKKPEKLLVVEGYMDVISLHQHKIPFAVAPLGTAITKKQIQVLTRYAHEIIFCFDADNAGQKAAWRAMEVLLPMMKDNLHAKFLTLPPGEDPDSFIRKKGREAFQQAIQTAEALTDFFFKTLSQPHDLNTIHGRAQFAKSCQKYLHTMPNGLFKQLMLEQLAKLIQVSTDVLNEYKEPSDQTTVTQTPYPTSPTSTGRRFQVKTAKQQKAPSVMRIAISLLVQYPHLIDKIQDIEMLKHIQLPGATLLGELIETIQANPNLSTASLLEHFREKPAQQLQLIKLASTLHPIPLEGIQSEFLGAIDRIQKQGIQQTINELQKKLHELSTEEKKMLQRLIAYKVSS